jgi:hypothetical protein
MDLIFVSYKMGAIQFAPAPKGITHMVCV